MKRFALVAVISLVSVASQATNLPMTFFSNAHQQSNLFNGFARDRSTGTYYKMGNYVGTTLARYSNLSDFQADTNSTVATLGGTRLGSYGAVRNGKLYMRTDANVNGTQVARYDATTGALEAYGNFPGYGGLNGTDTFNWGGYSAFNMFDDPSGLYMIGRDLGGNQRLNKLDSNFNILNSYIIGDYPNDPSFGFAFTIKGQMFIGDSFNSYNFARRVDLATGITTNVNFTFTGIPQVPYLSFTYYDELSDRLYVNSAGTGFGIEQATYILDNASGALGVVPEPGSLLAIATGLTALLAKRRRRP